MRAWVDASTLIALDAVGHLGVLRRYLGEVFITPAVRDEVLRPKASAELRRAVGDWIRVREAQGDRRRLRGLGLHPGESSLLRTPEEDLLILDEQGARRAAAAEGRRVTGLLGLLVGAVRDGVLSTPEAHRILDALAASRFYIAGDLLEKVRRELGR